MQHAISHYFSLSHRISQLKDLLFLDSHHDDRIYKAAKELLWYRGSDIYKQAFKLIAAKNSKGVSVLPSGSALEVLWRGLSSEAKTITLSLGFHTASSTKNTTISMLVENYRAELTSLFDFDYEGFRITELGRQLLSALFKSQVKSVSESALESSKNLNFVAKIKRMQKPVTIQAKNLLITGDLNSQTAAHALYQCLRTKSPGQGCFVIQDCQYSDATLSVNQHAYDNHKQFDYYVDATATTRSNFKSLAHDICHEGGYYYGSTRKSDTFDGRTQSSQCLLNLLRNIASTVDELPDDVNAPIIYISLKSIKEIIRHQAIFEQIERLANSSAQLCVCETEIAENNYIYKMFVDQVDVLHVIGNSDINERHEDYLPNTLKVAMQQNKLKKGDVYVKHQDGFKFDGEVVSLDYIALYMQLKGRFIRMF